MKVTPLLKKLRDEYGVSLDFLDGETDVSSTKRPCVLKEIRQDGVILERLNLSVESDVLDDFLNKTEKKKIKKKESNSYKLKKKTKI